MALHKDLNGDDLHEPKSHASSHESGGTDEISTPSFSFGSTDLKPSALPSIMQLIWELPALIASLEAKIEMLEHFAEDFKFLRNDIEGKPSARTGDLMQMLWELPSIISTLETKIALLSAEAKRANTNFDLNGVL